MVRKNFASDITCWKDTTYKRESKSENISGRNVSMVYEAASGIILISYQLAGKHRILC